MIREGPSGSQGVATPPHPILQSVLARAAKFIAEQREELECLGWLFRTMRAGRTSGYEPTRRVAVRREYS